MKVETHHQVTIPYSSMKDLNCIDMWRHTMAFGTPVVDHWIGKALKGLSDQKPALHAALS